MSHFEDSQRVPQPKWDTFEVKRPTRRWVQASEVFPEAISSVMWVCLSPVCSLPYKCNCPCASSVCYSSMAPLSPGSNIRPPLQISVGRMKQSNGWDVFSEVMLSFSREVDWTSESIIAVGISSSGMTWCTSEVTRGVRKL